MGRGTKQKNTDKKPCTFKEPLGGNFTEPGAHDKAL